MKKELKSELENLLENFNMRVTEKVKNQKNLEMFQEQYKEIVDDYMRRIEYILEDYGVSCGGKAFEYFREEFMVQGNFFSEKVPSVHIDDFLQGIRLMSNVEIEKNIEVLENETIDEESKKEMIDDNLKYRDQRMNDLFDKARRVNINSSGRLKEHCEEVYNDLEKFVIRIRISGLNSRIADKEYESISEKFYEMKVVFRRLSSELAENYIHILKSFDKGIIEEYLNENELYSKQVNEALESVKQLQQETEIPSLPEDPFSLSGDYKRKVVETGKKTSENQNNDEKKEDVLFIDLK